MFDLSALSFRHDASVSLYICSPISLAAYKCMHAYAMHVSDNRQTSLPAVSLLCSASVVDIP